MWPWQHKNKHKKQTLIIQLIGISSGIHLFFVLFLFFVYPDGGGHLRLTVGGMHDGREPVLFVPLKPPPKPASQKSVVVAKKPAPKPPIKKAPTTVAALKKVVPKKVLPKKMVAPKVVAKKPEPKKQPVQVSAKKEAPKKLVQQVVQQKTPIPNAEQVAYNMTDKIIDPVMQEKFAQLLEEAGKHWKPPAGIASDAHAHVKVLIDWQGSVRDIDIEKSSGILMYDIAARSASIAMHFPRWTWGKTITITFKQ